MRAVLIDPENDIIREVEYSGDYNDIYKFCDFDLFTCVGLGNGETLFVDDEGLFKENQSFFRIGDYHSPLAGKGLILGTDEEGESVASKISLAKLSESVEFLGKLVRI